jgi:hypothetical protein
LYVFPNLQCDTYELKQWTVRLRTGPPVLDAENDGVGDSPRF